MIRTSLAVILAAAILLCVWRYAEFTDQIKPVPVQFVETAAGGNYSLRVMCTFPCAGNAFGFPAVKVGFRDRILLERQGHVSAGEALQVDSIPDVQQGWNDFHVQVTPVEEPGEPIKDAFRLEGPNTTDDRGMIARCVKVAVFRDEHEVAHQLIWSDVAGPFGDLVRIQVRDSHATHQE